jgi:hypothetical protein
MIREVRIRSASMPGGAVGSRPFHQVRLAGLHGDDVGQRHPEIRRSLLRSGLRDCLPSGWQSSRGCSPRGQRAVLDVGQALTTPGELHESEGWERVESLALRVDESAVVVLWVYVSP